MVSRRNLLSFFSSFCIALFFLCSQSLSAQINSEKGAIRVGLTDAQGGTVAGAKVSVTSKTGAAQTKDSNPDGSTVFPLLDPGPYEITVESPNFRRTVLHDVAVHVTEITTLNIVLEVGEVTSEVVVSADVNIPCHSYDSGAFADDPQEQAHRAAGCFLGEHPVPELFQ